MTDLESRPKVTASVEDRIEDHKCCKCGSQADVKVSYIILLSKYYCNECEPDVSGDTQDSFDNFMK